MVDCGECVELCTDVLKAPSEVGGGGFTLRSDGVRTLGRDEGSFPWSGGVFWRMGGAVFGRHVAGYVSLAGNS